MAKLTDYGLTPRAEYQDVDCTQVARGRGHRYVVSNLDQPLLGVTSYLHIRNTADHLVPWARRQTAQRFQQALLDRQFQADPALQPGHPDYPEHLAAVAQAAMADDRTALAEGQATHHILENLLGHSQHQVDEPLRSWVEPAVQAALQAIALRQLTTVGVEIPIWHPHHHYGGSIDYLGRNPQGQLEILDWKRTNRVSKQHGAQVSAYAVALQELLGPAAAQPGLPAAQGRARRGEAGGRRRGWRCRLLPGGPGLPPGRPRLPGLTRPLRPAPAAAKTTNPTPQENCPMGYTHYWSLTTRPDPEVFAQLANDFQQLALASEINLTANPDDASCPPPRFDADTIRFNAVTEYCETFALELHNPSQRRLTLIDPADGPHLWDFCKTYGRPYDIVVAAGLLALKHHLGDIADVQSDGNCAQDQQWRNAVTLYQRVFPQRPLPDLPRILNQA